MALSNSEAWAQAAIDVRAQRPAAEVGPLDERARIEDLPTDDRAFMDAVEKRAVELGGNPSLG